MSRRTLLTIAVAVSTLVVSNTAHATELAPRHASDLVTLFAIGGPACPFGGLRMSMRVRSDGLTEPFSIPAEQVLVITDWQWGPVVRGVNAWESATLSLQTGGTNSLVGVSGGNTGGAAGVADGRTGSGPSIEGLVAVKPGVFICVGSQSGTLPFAVVHGFLAKDK